VFSARVVIAGAVILACIAILDDSRKTSPQLPDEELPLYTSEEYGELMQKIAVAKKRQNAVFKCGNNHWEERAFKKDIAAFDNSKLADLAEQARLMDCNVRPDKEASKEVKHELPGMQVESQKRIAWMLGLSAVSTALAKGGHGNFAQRNTLMGMVAWVSTSYVHALHKDSENMPLHYSSDAQEDVQSLSVDDETVPITTRRKSNEGTGAKIGESATTKLVAGRRGGELTTSGSFTMDSSNRAGNSEDDEDMDEQSDATKQDMGDTDASGQSLKRERFIKAAAAATRAVRIGIKAVIKKAVAKKVVAKKDYTTHVGNAPIGSVCESSCVTTAPPSSSVLGLVPGTRGWCFADNEKSKGASHRLWGECGGCEPGSYKPIGRSSCSGRCSASCRTCTDVKPNKYHGFSGKDVRNCNSCKEGWSPRNPYWGGPDTYIFYCQENLDGSKNKMQCRPYQGLKSADATSYVCMKAGTKTVSLMHPDFWIQNNPNYKNWWAARCFFSKMVKCVADQTSGATRCQVHKTATCLEVCRGYNGGLGSYDPDVAMSATRDTQITNTHGETNLPRKCYPGCTNQGSDIKATSPWPGKSTSTAGPQMAKQDWCREEASGY